MAYDIADFVPPPPPSDPPATVNPQDHVTLLGGGVSERKPAAAKEAREASARAAESQIKALTSGQTPESEAFLLDYNKGHREGHEDAVKKMRELESVAHPEPELLSDEEQKNELRAHMENRHGKRAGEKIALAIDVAKRLFDHEGTPVDLILHESGHGNNTEIFDFLIEMAELDEEGFPSVGFANELLSKIRTRDQARVELRRRERDPDFQKALHTRSHVQHEEVSFEAKFLNLLVALGQKEELIGGAP